MKKFNSILVLFIALLSAQWVSAQCNGTISSSGSGATFTFTSTNPTSAAQMHSWDFGDGTYGVGQTATHTYTASGSYMVMAIFGDSINMCADYDSLLINAVVTGGTTCSAAFNTTGTSPSFTFTPTGTPTAPPGYFSYDWDFGDGTVAVGNNNPTHTYTANGTYSVTCTFYDSIWCMDTATNTVVVTGINNPTCDASFTYTDSNGVYNFMASFPTASTSYTWTLSNGAVYSGANPTVAITQPGTYTMCLDISDFQNQCFDSSCVSFTVATSGGPICDASFNSVNSGNTYTFTPSFPDASATYSWSFGDGSTSTSATPTHTYTTNGTYVVSCNRVIPNQCNDISDTGIFITNIPTNGIISGVINMGATYADYGVVFLVANDSIGNLSLVDTTNIDSMGMYYFANVPFGTYLVKAALSPNSSNFSNYMPSYHASSASASGVLLWSDASDVVLNTAFVNNVDINLVAGSNAGGAGFIGGLVSQGANKTGDPISDINIMVLDENGNPVSYTYSDIDGSFQIDNLANGTYTVYPEVEGRVTTPIDVVITDNSIGTNDIRVVVNTTTVEANIVTSVRNAISHTDVSIYPNPVLNELNIEINQGTNQAAMIVISDITGKEIMSFQGNTGTINQINTSSLETGIYILTVNVNGEVSNFKFVK